MNNHALYFENIIEYNGKWFLFDNARKCFMNIDPCGFSITPITTVKVPSQWENGFFSYGKTILVNSKIYAVPTIPAPIVAYDLRTNTVEYIDFRIDYSYNPGSIFSDVCLYDDHLYFIPCCYDSVVSLSIKDHSLNYISLRDFYKKETGPFFAWKGYYLDGSRLCFGVHTDNRIISVDLDSYTTETIFEAPSYEKVAGVVADEVYVWAFSMFGNRIYKIKKSDYSMNGIIESFPEGYKVGDFSFSGIVEGDNFIYALPRQANMVIRVDKRNDNIEQLISKPEAISNSIYEKYYAFCSVYEYGGRTLLFETEKGRVHTIDADQSDQIVELVGSRLKSDYMFFESSIYKEDALINLDMLLNSI